MKIRTLQLHIIALVLGMFSACTGVDTKKAEPAVNSVLDYTLTGTGDTTILFIHGWCINRTYWDDQVEFFRGRWRVLTVDLAGHGKSNVQRVNWSIESYSKDIVDLVLQLELKEVVLVGHSMSGNIALHVYGQIPERVVGFVGVDNLQQLGVERSAEELEMVNGYFDEMEKDFANQSVVYATGNLFSSSTSAVVKDRVLNDFRKSDPQMAVGTLRSLQFEGAKEKTMAAALKVPMLLIVSDNGQSPLVDDESLQKYAGAGYKVFPITNIGHYPMIEDPARFNAVLTEVLQQVASPAKR